MAAKDHATSRQIPPRILAVRASAGAGKTYQLTIRFLELLRQMAPTGHTFPSAQALRQIVAITFTNRAAAEMKERIILALKQMALETDEGKKLAAETRMKPVEAGVWLDIILDHFDDFQVRTIDSLIYTLMRAFAIEMGLPPELEVDFDQAAVLDRCFDSVLASVQWDNQRDRKQKTILDLLETYLYIEQSPGMLVQGRIKERLTKLYAKASEANADRARPDLSAASKKLDAGVSAFLKGLRDTGVDQCLAMNKCRMEYLESPYDHLGKPFWENPTVTDILKKMHETYGHKTIASVDRLYGDAKQAREDYLYCHARMRIYPYVLVLDELREEVRRQTEREGVVLGGNWHDLIKSYFREGNVTGAYAFLKFGSQIRHFLIDEFQDTSPVQWEALRLLAEESLSVGGTLFYVGDVKQAIYGWRGGDWRLFPKVVAEEFPSVPPESRTTNVLDTNYRSLPSIVEFNNKVFGTLNDQQFVGHLSKIMMPNDAPDENASDLAATILRNFEDARQKVSAKLKERGDCGDRGQVHLTLIAGTNDEIYEAVRESLMRDIKQVWKRRKKGIAVLVRTNEHAEAIATWLVAEGIPIVTENSLRLKTSALIKGIVSLLHFLEYPLDDISFWGAIASPLFRGLPEGSDQSLDAFIRQGRWKSPLYRTFEKEFPPLSNHLVRPLLAASCLLAPYELVREVIDRLDLLSRFPDEAVFIYRFLEVVHGAEAKGSISLSLFLEFWDEGGMEEQIGLPDDVSAVRILTIHKAKGLEFPVVFIPFTSWRRRSGEVEISEAGDLVWLSARKGTPLPTELRQIKLRTAMESVIENLNMLYVATTRPKEELHLYVTCLTKQEKPDSQYLALWLKEMLAGAGIGEQ